MIKNYKKLLLSLLLTGFTLCARTFHGPLHFVDTHSKFVLPLINESDYNLECDENVFQGEIRPFVGFYNRHADKAFGTSLSNCTSNYYSLFHGKSSFKISELFENSKLPTVLDANTQNDMYVDGTISPCYSYSEHGAYIGFDVSKLGCGDSDNVRMQMKVRLPIKSISVKNKKGWNALVVDTNADDGEATIDPRVKLNQTDETFAAPLDWLINEGIISKENTPKIIFTIDTVKLGPDTNSTTLADIAVSFNSITEGGMAANEAVTNLTSSIYFDDTLSAFYVSDNTAAAVTADLYVPLSFITAINNFTNFYFQGAPLFVTPVLISGTKYFYPKNNFQFKTSNNVRDFSTATTNSITTAATTLNITNENFLHAIIATTNPVNNASFTTPPVLITKNLSSIQPILSNNLPFSSTNNLETIGTSGLAVVNPRDISNFIDLNTGTGLNNNFEFGTVTSSTDGAFWFEVDYKNTDTSNPDLYVYSSLETSGEPTEASQALYDYLKKLKSPIYEKNELIGDLSGSSHLGIKKNMYDTYCRQGLGDLDVEFSLGKNFCDNKFEGDISAGIVFPTASSKRDTVNYLYESLGNEGHYEGRLSAEGLYHMNDWAEVIGYASFTHVFKSHEYVINAFKNSKAFGLQPANTLVDISWNQVVANLDLRMNWCNVAFNIGYQFVHKFKDSYDKCKNTGLNAVADYQNLSFSKQICLSERQMHKIRASLVSNYFDNVSMEIGLLETVAGKNAAKDHEYFIRLMYSF